jgi:hypothetical protein
MSDIRKGEDIASELRVAIDTVNRWLSLIWLFSQNLLYSSVLSLKYQYRNMSNAESNWYAIVTTQVVCQINFRIVLCLFYVSYLKPNASCHKFLVAGSEKSTCIFKLFQASRRAARVVDRLYPC